MSGLAIENVKKTFGNTPVLKGVSLEIDDGEFLSLVGPSGCGKSTLLRIIAGLEEQTSGSIKIGGNDVTGVRAADRNLSMVFQSYALYPHLTVAENIAVPLRMRKMSGLQRLPIVGSLLPGSSTTRAEIRQAVHDAAKTLEISQLMDRKPGQLSGGQRQRVALGRALVRNPAAFLLDEPLSNLDAKLRVQTRSEIAQLHRRLGATFIYVTHDQVEAMTMSNRIAVMMGGEILQCSAPEIIYDDPNHINVAEFIGSPKINVLPIEARNGFWSFNNIKLNLKTVQADGTLKRLGLRPEKIALSYNDGFASGSVTHVENLGSEVYAQVIIRGHDVPLVLRAMPSDRSRLKINANVSIEFAPNDCLIFDADGKRNRAEEAASKTLEYAE